MPPTTRQRTSKIQAKLDFSPISKDSVQAQQLAPSVRARASAVRYYSPKKAKTIQITSSLARNVAKTKSKPGAQAQQQRLQLSTRSSRAEARLTRSEELGSTDDPFYGSQRKSSPGPNSRLDFPSSGAPNGVRNTGRSTLLRSSPPARDDEDEDEDEDDEEDIILPSIGIRPRPQVIDDDESDVVDDDLDISTASSRKRISRRISDDEDETILPSLVLRNQVNARSSIDVDGSTGSEDEPILPSSARQPRRYQALTIDSDDSDDIIPSSTRITKRLRSGQDHVSSSSPTKKRRLQQGQKPRKMTREEQDEEVQDDAKDLQDTATLNQGLRSASKINEKKLARQRQLSKLAARRNRNGPITIESASPSPEAEEGENHFLPTPYNDVYSDDNSSQADSLIDDADLDAPSPTSSTEEIRINRSIYDIPSALYYTIQQLLYTKFLSNPSTNKTTNTYYTAAHSLLSKRLESYANQHISSIWRRDFSAALHARPRLTWPRHELTIWESCEACGRRDHPARFVMRFEGSCYDEWTLQEIADEDSSVFQKFDTHVPANAVWHVGADCHDNAWRAHRAVHWRFGLRVQIEKALGMMGVRVEDDEEIEEEGTELEREDRYQAVLLQMEDQGYIQALQDEFLERFEMVDDEEDEDD